MLNKNFIQRKITLIEDELKNLLSFANYSFEEIANDPVKLAAVERFLERIVNRAIDINQHIIYELAEKNTNTPVSYTETFLALAELKVYPYDFAKEIAKSASTRNVLVHEYDKVNKEEVYHSIGDCLKDYNKYCEYILKFLERRKTAVK